LITLGDMNILTTSIFFQFINTRDHLTYLCIPQFL
jgi:hypothetical protein